MVSCLYTKLCKNHDTASKNFGKNAKFAYLNNYDLLNDKHVHHRHYNIRDAIWGHVEQVGEVVDCKAVQIHLQNDMIGFKGRDVPVMLQQACIVAFVELLYIVLRMFWL